MLELCKHPEIQKKVQDEIDRVLIEANSEEISYDMLHKMKYLECCIDEALRKYPIVPILNRECSKEHKFAGTNWTLKKGTPIIIPVQGLHRDPDIYENPLEFRPERFIDSSNGNGKSNGVFYLPFGDGPRLTIFYIYSHDSY
jgi:cytochrome P450 family 6